MRKIFLIFLLAFFFSLDVFAQASRSTSFDDRPICEQSKGVWRQFGNGCVDECRPKLDQFYVCTDSSAYGCDCGKGRCWNGEACMSLQDYKKIFDKEQEEEQKILAEAKQKRKEAAQENEKEMMAKIISQIPATSLTPDPNSPIQPNNNLAQFYQDKDAKTPPPAEKPLDTKVVQKDATKTDEVPVIGLPGTIAPSQNTPPAPSGNPKIPPLFLQQQKAKEDAAAAAKTPSQTQGTTQSNTSGSVPPGLPEIPLPN